MHNTFFQGFFLQASLILALGAQNIYVLNSGLHRQRHFLVALLSALCDMTLILIGVLGVASIFAQVPLLKIGFGIVGVGFLGFYGFLKLKEASSQSASSHNGFSISSLNQTIITTLSFSLLNPHVYLDTIVLLGGYSTKFHDIFDRFLFGLGASLLSFIWFFGLVGLASYGNKLINNQFAMKLISSLSGLVLISLSIKLSVEVWRWSL